MILNYSILAATLIVTVFATNAYAKSDSVSDLSIRTTFKFPEGTEDVNSFKVFTQNSGYKWGQTPMFKLWCGVSADKEILYKTAEVSYEDVEWHMILIMMSLMYTSFLFYNQYWYGRLVQIGRAHV